MVCPIKAELSRAQQNWAELSRAEAEAVAETALCSAQLQDIDFAPGLPVVGLHVTRVEVLPRNVRRGSTQRITQQSIKINNFCKYTKKHTHTHSYICVCPSHVSVSQSRHRAQRKCIWQIQREKCSLRAALEARTRAFRLKGISSGTLLCYLFIY